MTYPPPYGPQGANPPGGGTDPFGSGYQLPAGGLDPFTGAPPTVSGYPHGAPAAGPPPPKKDNTQWVIATVAAFLIVAVVVGGLLWRMNSGAEGAQPVASPTSSTSTRAAPAPSSVTPTTTAAPTTAVPAPPARAGECEGRTAGASAQTPPGWSTVLSPRGLVYDVPSDWTVEKCTVLLGWEKPCPDGPFGFCPIRTMSGAASMPNPQCPEGNRGVTGVPGAKNTSDIAVAVQTESETVADIYTSKSGVVPTVSLSPPRNFTVAGAPAVEVLATVTGIEADQCTGSSALHAMVATTVPGQPGTVLFIVALEQGYPGAPDPALVGQLVSTLRQA